jgi:serine/threonine-protein kinase
LSLGSGRRLGAYEVIALLGAGGMGEVYRARDTKLNRDVALKILPEAFAIDGDRIARFRREAQVLASLNHPNIAAIYGFEDSGSTHALVLELIEGPTLADRIAKGPIPLDEALPIAKQIAEALEAAHEQGIIHRDLKPANIKLRDDGTVKVLDFGLAKALEPASAISPMLTASPTITTPAQMTGVGMILGTAAYMSPEQAKGRPADKRSDIWAFGCVFYEMLNGKRAFDGEDVSETLAFVLTKEPDWNALPANTPVTIRRLLRRALEKDRKRRLPDIGSARLDIDEALSAPATELSAASVIDAAPSRSGWRTALWALAAALGSAMAAGVGTWIRLAPTPPPVLRLNLTPADGGPVGNVSLLWDVAITPDGNRVVYGTGQTLEALQLFVRGLDQLDATPIKGLRNPIAPFPSPDSEWVGYFEASPNLAMNTMKKVSITGGPSVPICATPQGLPGGASWGSDGTIVFASGGTLLRVADGGGTPEVLAKPDSTKGEFALTSPEILPGGRAVLFTILPIANRLENGRIVVRDLKTGQTKVLVQGGTDPHYVQSGHLVYAAAGSLRAVRFDLDRLELRGTAVPIVDHVATKGGTAAAMFAIARNGTLLYRTGDIQGVAALRTLVWVDRQGHEEALGVPPRAYAYVHLSPDNSKLALDIRDQENDIWTWDLLRHGPLTRLTFDPGFNRVGVWSRPDGKKIAFSAERDGTEDIYEQAADGSGKAERLTKRSGQTLPQAFTPDGTQLLFVTPANAPYDIGVVSLTGDRHVDLLLHDPQSETNPEISPDGKWLAYQSDENGMPEIYVRPFPNVETGRTQVSFGGGTRPVWAPMKGGHELFYESPEPNGARTLKIWAVSVDAGGTFGMPQRVVDGPYLTPQAGRSYDVSTDGKRFVMIKDATPASTSSAVARPSQLVVVLNWQEELKQRVPSK